MRVKRDFRAGSIESYNTFRERHPEVRITYKKYKEIIYEFTSRWRKHILETGEKTKLPFGLGELSIQKKKTKRLSKNNKIALPVDWVATKKAGFRVYNFNQHTEGYRFKWIWYSMKARFRYSNLWVFKPSRETSRLLAKYLKDETKDYQHIYREW